METLVVGTGAMGRWLGQALRADGPETDLAFTDIDHSSARDTADALGGRVVPRASDATFDAVAIAVPIPAVTDAIATHAPQATRAVYDVTGVMADPIAAMRESAPDCERLSLHPLFAPENEPGSIPAVADAPGPITDAVRATLSARGNDVFETTATEHDEAMETVQAQTHAAVLAFALAGESVPDHYHTPISGELAALAAQVTSGEPRVYADIQSAFDGADDVAAAARRIAAADADEFTRLFEEAGSDR